MPGELAAGPITVGLLGGDFEVDTTGDVLVVRRELSRSEVAPRTLLGKPTPCVGRDRELDELDSLFDECVDEGRARVALFVGPSGVGKSRLRYEWLERLYRRDRVPQVVLSRGDAMTSGAPLALAGASRRVPWRWHPPKTCNASPTSSPRSPASAETTR